MPNYELSNLAVEDLDNIWNYTIDNWSEQQADKYYQNLIASCKNIAANSGIGKNFEGVSKKYFGLKVDRHIIFYRKVLGGPVIIVRILHQRMDWQSRLSE